VPDSAGAAVREPRFNVSNREGRWAPPVAARMPGISGLVSRRRSHSDRPSAAWS